MVPQVYAPEYMTSIWACAAIAMKMHITDQLLVVILITYCNARAAISAYGLAASTSNREF